MTEHFSNIKDILKGVQFRSANPAFGQIISDWNELVGKKFAGKSEIADIYTKGLKVILHVTVVSSPLVQELTFFKRNLIKKIKENYNLEVEDVIIKASPSKKETTKPTKQNLVLEVYDQRPTDEELKQITLEQNVVEEMKASVEKQPVLTRAQKNRMLEVILNDLKTQEWMKQKGFPICEKCGRVLTRKNFGEKNLCNSCKEN